MASDLRTFEYEALSSHNKRREDHGVPPLKLDPKLCRESQRWAEHLARTGRLEHSDTKDYGENLSSSYNSGTTEYTGTQVSDYWYSEMEKFDFRSRDFQKGTGHFSQMVWKGSKEMGIGKAITRDGKVIVVGQYKPAGNVMGQFQDNVFPVRRGVTVNMGAMTTPTGSGRSGSSYSNDDEMKTRESRYGSWNLQVGRREQDEFQEDALKTHNEYRVHHKAPALVASKELNMEAQKWAEHLANNDIFEHSKATDIGENVAMHYSSSTTAYSGKEASDHWYSEMSKYNFSAPGFTKGAGHFTQMVWKDSREFGIGKAITKEGKVIIVGQYRPPGNVVNHFDGNVLPRDDGYVPPPPQTGPSRVNRVVSGEPDRRTVSGREIDDAVRRTGQLKLDKADTSPKDLNDFRKDLFKAQNEIREKHGAAWLSRSPDLMDRAQKFAAYLAERGLFQNSTEDDVGENIAMHYSSASTEFSGQQCADMWYKQVEKYNFERPEFTKGAGHFTQMVWRDSKEFGAGKAVTREGKVILVGFYKPPGNVMRRFEENVGPANK